MRDSFSFRPFINFFQTTADKQNSKGNKRTLVQTKQQQMAQTQIALERWIMGDSGQQKNVIGSKETAASGMNTGCSGKLDQSRRKRQKHNKAELPQASRKTKGKGSTWSSSGNVSLLMQCCKQETEQQKSHLMSLHGKGGETKTGGSKNQSK